MVLNSITGGVGDARGDAVDARALLLAGEDGRERAGVAIPSPLLP